MAKPEHSSTSHEKRPKTPNFLRLYNQRLQRLQPLTPEQLAEWLDHSDSRSTMHLAPYKFTSCVLTWRGEPEDWQILMGTRRESGWWQGAHQEILTEFELHWFIPRVYSAVLIVDAKKHRHLLTSAAEDLSDDETIGSLYSRYQIQKVWQAKSSLAGLVVDTDSRDHFSVFDRLAQADALSQVVQTYGLTDMEKAALQANPELFWRTFRKLPNQQTSE